MENGEDDGRRGEEEEPDKEFARKDSGEEERELGLLTADAEEGTLGFGFELNGFENVPFCASEGEGRGAREREKGDCCKTDRQEEIERIFAFELILDLDFGVDGVSNYSTLLTALLSKDT